MPPSTDAPGQVLVVLARDLVNASGKPITDDELVESAGLAVNFFVERSVAGLDVDGIEAVVGPGDGRRIRPREYAEQLHRFATAPEGTLVVSRTALGRVYLVGRLLGPYEFSPGRFPGHPHVRPVLWACRLPEGLRLDGNRYTSVRYLADPDLRSLVSRSADGLRASRSS